MQPHQLSHDQLQLLLILLVAIAAYAFRNVTLTRLAEPRIEPMTDTDRAQLVDLLAATLTDGRR